jgi:cytochrome c-type biogenesis protein CcmE
MSGKKKNTRFMVGLVGVAAVITYLMATGVRDAMVYYITPGDLVMRLEEDPTFREVGVKVGAKLVQGSYSRTEDRLHSFRIVDMNDPSVTIPVVFAGILPDTFRPEDPTMELVVEGRFRPDGVFEAKEVFAKCGSRYEATDEALAG